jgi:hypothetical protein
MEMETTVRMRNRTFSILQYPETAHFTFLVRTGVIFPSNAFVFPNQTKARRAQVSKKGLSILASASMGDGNLQNADDGFLHTSCFVSF